MADDEMETEGTEGTEGEELSLRQILDSMGDNVVAIAIFDTVPDCSNPYCGNEAIGMIDHPILGMCSVCGDCLDVLNRLGRIVETVAGSQKDEADWERAIKVASAEFN